MFSVLGDMFRPTWPSSGNTHCVRNYWVEIIDKNDGYNLLYTVARGPHVALGID